MIFSVVRFVRQITRPSSKPGLAALIGAILWLRFTRHRIQIGRAAMWLAGRLAEIGARLFRKD